MAELVNLRQAKKASERAGKRATGGENAARFGRTKAEKGQDRAEALKAREHLDAHKREPE